MSILPDFHVGLWVHITEYRDASNILADLFEDFLQLMLCRIIIIQLDDICIGIWISRTGKFHSLPFPDHYLAFSEFTGVITFTDSGLFEI